MTKKLFIIDGYSFVFRAYHSMPPLSSPNGTPIGAAYGFTNMLIRLLKDQQPEHAIVVFDSGSKNFRHQLYDQYKANRPSAPEDLIPQFDIVRKATTALGFKSIEQQGYEADDLIASIAKQAESANIKSIIFSSDKDLMQLINQNITMFDPMKRKEITDKEVFEKFSVRPDQVLDFLSMVGDSSDNIPGVPSIGAKTAAELLKEFDTIEGVYENLEKITQKRRQDSLRNNKDLAFLSKQLVSLKSDIHLPFNIEDLTISPPNNFQEFAKEHGFKSLIAPAGVTFQGTPEKETSSLKIKEIKNSSDLKSAFSNSLNTGKLFFLHLIDEKHPESSLFSFASNSQEMFFCHLSDSNSQNNLFEIKSQISISDLKSEISTFLQNDSILKITHNVKQSFKHFGEFSSFDDLQLMSYVTNNGISEHSFEAIVAAFFEASEAQTISSFLKPDKSSLKFTESNPDKLQEFVAIRQKFAIDLHKILKETIENQGLKTIYEKFDKPLIPVLHGMEEAGILVDPKILSNLLVEFEQILKNLEREIHQAAGQEFNIASPKQLSHILFNVLSIPTPGNSSKSTTPSTNIEVLEELSMHGHIIADHLIKWRQISKLKSTYVEALLNQINPKTGRIHTNFLNCSTSTGRLSSSEPNLQNIPIRSAEATRIREAFIASPGHQLISADYSQIELRILAAMANLETLTAAFKNNQDIHSLTASQVFGVPLAEIDSNMRRKAKAINFGIIYGISAFGLARQLNITNHEAKSYIEKYFKEYPGIEKYMEDTKNFASKHGYVTTFFNRKCHFPLINSQNFMQKSLTQRAAINAPIQGTAADILKKAMIKLNRIFQDEKIEAKILLQIHDELLIEVKTEIAEKVANLTKKIMEESATLKTVPLTVDIHIGKTWAEIH